MKKGFEQKLQNKIDDITCKVTIAGAYHTARFQMRHPIATDVCRGLYAAVGWSSMVPCPLRIRVRGVMSKVRDLAAALVVEALASKLSTHEPVRCPMSGWRDACLRTSARARELGLEELAQEIEQ